ncbi:hypothetical protein [Raineya sp.]|jgi:preprotein translocase subunit SecG
MRAIIILLAILVGAVVLIRSTQKQKPKPQEENFSGLVDGATSVASSLTILVFVVVGVIIVVALVLVKKTTENPDRAFEVAGKGADLYSKIKRA